MRCSSASWEASEWRTSTLLVIALAGVLACSGAVSPVESSLGDDGSGGNAGGDPGEGQDAQGGSGGQGSNGAGGSDGIAGGPGSEGGHGTELDAGPSQGGSADGGVVADGGLTGDGGILAPDRPSPDHVPMFIVQGGGFRTVVSCDDGKSWALHVPGNGDGGDHSAGAPQGLAAGAGRFVTANGWGAGGSLRASEDGLAWKAVRSNGGGYGGVLFVGNTFIVVDGGVLASSDGTSWQPVGNLDLGTHQRRFTGLRTEDGWLAVVTGYEGVGNGGSERKVAVSKDLGRTWRVTNIPDCVVAQQFEGGVAYGAGVLVSVGSNGGACRSLDSGATWSAVGNVGGSVGSVLWDGQSFRAYGGGRVYLSDDGMRWQTQALAGASAIWYAARAPGGTYAAVAGDGGQYFRSDDGRRWTKVNGPAGTRFRHMTFGYGRASAMCAR